MKKLLAIFLVSFLLVPMVSMGQAGYLGKRVDIQYTPSLGNAWLRNFFDPDTQPEGAKPANYPGYPRYNAANRSKKSNIINLKHRFLLNYTISSKSSIGFSYSLARYGMWVDDIGVPNADSTVVIPVETSGNVEETDFALRYVKYKNGTAPIGNYFALSIGMSKTKGYAVVKGLSGHFNEKELKTPFLGVEVGRNILIGKGLFLSVGLETQLSPWDEGSNESNRSYKFNILRPTLGLGYIPF